MGNIICSIQEITKLFPGVVALDNVSFDVREGEVHAVVGENGAGKSTLMNILSGVYQADRGSVTFQDREVRFREPRDAQNAGIAMIHQELSLSPHLSAAENVFEGRMLKNRLGLIDRKRMGEVCAQHLKQLGVDTIDPSSLVEELSVSEMQLLEIVKAMSLGSRMLIMDEPTSSLTNREVQMILQVVRSLQESGVAILYISHKLEEIMEIADTVTVLCDGKHIGTRPRSEMDLPTMISMMVGREYSAGETRKFLEDYSTAQPVLEVEHLSDKAGRVQDVSFTLYEGEVLGLTGLIGAGRSELLQTIFGINPRSAGTVKIRGKEVVIKRPRDAMEQGMALIPEGRKIQGLFLDLSVEDNMAVTQLRNLKGALGLLSRRKIRKVCSEYRDRLRVKTPSLDQHIVNLSGGNQQKVIIARWLMNRPILIFMDEPTHGIDIGAKNEIYKIIDELSSQGVAVVLLSSELPEVLANCDRIMVMHHGRLRGIMMNREADQVKIMEYTLEQ